MAIALVTGSTRGLGHATAHALAAAGYTVIVSGRDPDAVRTARRSVETTGSAVDAVLDVTDPAGVAKVRDWISDEFGQLDLLVNNAGILPEASDPADHAFGSADLFRATLDTNVVGAVAVTEALLPLIVASPAGRIVNVSTAMGSLAHQSDPHSPWYAMHVPAYQASKAALNTVTIGLAKRLADTPVVVTSVCPGWMQTDLAPGNHEHAPLTAHEGAAVVVRAATLPAGSASGTFIDAAGRVDW